MSKIQAIVSSFLALTLGALAQAQSTAFTYQGALTNGTQFADGPYDFRFRLYDDPTNGVQIGTTVCIDNVSVADGFFSAAVDFGQQFLTSNIRYLEVESRPDTGLDCSNATGFSVTGLRQQITDSPIAVHAHSTSTLTDPIGNSIVSADNVGNIGVGTSSPIASLHIRAVRPSIGLRDTAGAFAGSYVTYLNSSGAETGWFGFGHPNSPIMSVANGRPGGHIALLTSSTGNVGFGTAVPVGKLEVRGDIRLGPTGQNFALRSQENLRVLRGELNSAGTRIRGTGFTSSRLAAGRYQITFTTPFPEVPTVLVASWQGAQASTANTDSADASSVVVTTYSTLSDTNADSSFEFVVIGQR